MVRDLPTSAFRCGLPPERNWIVTVCAMQSVNGAPTVAPVKVTQGEPASTVVGTPSAAQFALRVGLPVLMNCWSHGSLTKPKLTLFGANRSFSVGTRTERE